MKFYGTLTLSFCASIVLTGCLGGGGGGGGGGPSIPTITPTPPPVVEDPTTITPDPTPADPAAAEYNLNPALPLAKVKAAWDAGYTGAGVKVAVIDTGIDVSHSAFTGAMDASHAVSRSTIASYNAADLGSTSYYGNDGWSAAYQFVTGDQIANVKLTMTNSSQTYTVGNEPTITITGDGTGATAKAFVDTFGYLHVAITNPGSGYTHATVTVNDLSGNITGSTAVLGGVDENGHGTFVSSQIIGNRDSTGIVGVAYGSELYSIRASSYQDPNNIDMGIVGDSVDFARTQGVKVINQSFGSYTNMAGYGVDTAYRAALQANISVVTAAGNDGQSCATINQCLRPAALPWESGMGDLLTQDGAWMVVGALNADGSDIASYSNRAGITKNNYILAPGTGNVGAIAGGGLGAGNGTSYAAPIVAGTMALMYEKWPSLTGRQIAQIIYNTTDDMGAAGVDDIYGNGKLNVERAFSPAGVLSVPVTGGAISSAAGNNVASSAPTARVAGLTNTTMRTGTAMGAALQSFAPINDTIALDSYNRDFQIGLGSAIQSKDPLISDTIDFDNYTKARYRSFVVGSNMLDGSGAIGLQVDPTLRVMMTYKDDLFGTTGEGLLGFSNARTMYFNAHKVMKNDEYKLETQLTYGYGEAKESGASLIKDISSVHGIGGKIKASYEGTGLAYEVPMHVFKGTMGFDIPTGVTRSGDIIINSQNASLSPDTFEQKIGLFHEFKKGNFSFWAQANHVFNKFNIAGMSDDEVSFMVGLYY